MNSQNTSSVIDANDRFGSTEFKQTVTLKVGDNEPIEVEKTRKCGNVHNRYVTELYHDTYEAAEQFRKAMRSLVKE